jgi:hypothetical protein
MGVVKLPYLDDYSITGGECSDRGALPARNPRVRNASAMAAFLVVETGLRSEGLPVYHVILIAIIATLFLAVWNLVHATPRSVQLLISPGLSLWAGSAMLVVSMFFAFAAAVLVQSGPGMIGFMLQGHIGFWVLSIYLREDEDALRRAFLMLAALLVVIVGAFYIQDPYGIALLSLVLLGGFLVLNHEERFLNSGR